VISLDAFWVMAHVSHDGAVVRLNVYPQRLLARPGSLLRSVMSDIRSVMSDIRSVMSDIRSAMSDIRSAMSERRSAMSDIRMLNIDPTNRTLSDSRNGAALRTMCCRFAGMSAAMSPRGKPPATFRRLFIANRGEVSARIARACDALGITPVFGVSEADQGTAVVRDRETVLLGPGRAALSYLDPMRVVQAAKQARCSALHPGWGFLSENPLLAALCEQHGITFVGPPAQAMALMGRKSPAKDVARRAGLTLIPGSNGALADAKQALEVANATGYPVLFKAESGGGGRGMRIARKADEVEQAFNDATSEATAAFGDSRVFMEKLLEGGRHVEIQVMADRYGNVIHIGERDCTVQRNHQKLIEESPSPLLDPSERARTFEAAVRAAASIGYVGAGTMEFLMDEGGTLRFMEMNTRLQVEHPVSEMQSGLDLMQEMIRVCAGHKLSVTQDQVKLQGHSIECRINAEDPSDNFRPSPGTITRFTLPDLEGGNVRVDTHIESGYVVPPFYDSLICKVIVHAETRDLAIERMLRALSGMVVEGVKTTIPMHQQILKSEAFRTSQYTTRAIPGWS
jgi:acetyl-CoA carboxylase biotin carboxylase subunit